MKVLYFIAFLIVAPLNWIFMHISNWLMMANAHINIWLITHTRKEG